MSLFSSASLVGTRRKGPSVGSSATLLKTTPPNWSDFHCKTKDDSRAVFPSQMRHAPTQHPPWVRGIPRKGTASCVQQSKLLTQPVMVPFIEVIILVARYPWQVMNIPANFKQGNRSSKQNRVVFPIFREWDGGTPRHLDISPIRATELKKYPYPFSH